MRAGMQQRKKETEGVEGRKDREREIDSGISRSWLHCLLQQHRIGWHHIKTQLMIQI